MKFFEWLFSRGSSATQQAELDEELRHWRIVEIDGAQGLVVARVRIRRPDLADISEYTMAVSISWPYESENEMPDAETTAEMDQLERLLESLEDFSYLILVRTGLRERTWLYYTSQPERFTEGLEAMLPPARQAMLTVQLLEDAEWSEWRVLADRVAEGAA